MLYKVVLKRSVEIKDNQRKLIQDNIEKKFEEKDNHGVSFYIEREYEMKNRK